MPDDENSKLNLLSRDVNDLMVVSSMLQDAIVSAEDMAYLEKERAFVMVVNRFQWEQPARMGQEKGYILGSVSIR